MEHEPRIKQKLMMNHRLALGFAALLMVTAPACSKNSENAAAPAAQPNIPLGDGTSVPALDLLPEHLSPNGCLDLSLLKTRMSQFPAGSLVRENTQRFSMENRTVEGRALQHPRNMSAMTALSNLFFAEAAAPDFVGQLPAVSQEGCDNVTFTDLIGGKTTYAIVPSDKINILRLQITSSKTVGGRDELSVDKEVTYTLNNPRELEIKSMSAAMDPCPDHGRARATSIRLRTWGTQEEIASKPVSVSVGFLRKLSIAIKSMPSSLTDLLAEDSEESLVNPAAADLVSLRSAALDPRVMHCPYEATPPGTDEAPPAEETAPAPTPTPEPTPEPAPTPEPPSSSNPFPFPF